MALGNFQFRFKDHEPCQEVSNNFSNLGIEHQHIIEQREIIVQANLIDILYTRSRDKDIFITQKEKIIEEISKDKLTKIFSRGLQFYPYK